MIAPSLADEATRAAALLAPFGISLLEAARMAVVSKNAEIASFNGLARLISAFWRWSAKHPRDWCDAKRVEILEREETTKDEIEALNARQCLKLLKTAKKHYSECVPGFAISLFIGVRKAELTRLQVSDVTSSGINLPATSTKTGRRRFIQMPTPLKGWLKAHPLEETVLPANWHKKEKAVRRLAGWKVWSDLEIRAVKGVDEAVDSYGSVDGMNEALNRFRVGG